MEITQKELTDNTATSMNLVSNGEQYTSIAQLDKVLDLRRTAGLSDYLTEGYVEN